MTVAHISPLCLLCFLQEYVQCVGKKCWTPKTTSRRLCETCSSEEKKKPWPASAHFQFVPPSCLITSRYSSTSYEHLCLFPFMLQHIILRPHFRWRRISCFIKSLILFSLQDSGFYLLILIHTFKTERLFVLFFCFVLFFFFSSVFNISCDVCVSEINDSVWEHQIIFLIVLVTTNTHFFIGGCCFHRTMKPYFFCPPVTIDLRQNNPIR